MNFIYKINIVEQEADEWMYFVKIFKEISNIKYIEKERLYKKGNELLPIVAASIKNNTQS